MLFPRARETGACRLGGGTGSRSVEVNDINDHFVTIAERGVKTIEAVGAVGAHIDDLFPIRKSSVS